MSRLRSWTKVVKAASTRASANSSSGATALGARVIATVRERHGDFVRSLGADEVVDYTQEDYVAAIGRLTGGRGADLVLDTIGGETLSRSPLALADAGRVVSLVDTAQPQNLIAAWGRNAAYHFVFTRQNRGKLDALTNLVERGLVRPIIGATFPLAEIAAAHTLLETASAHNLRGKVVIDVTPGAPAPQDCAAALVSR